MNKWFRRTVSSAAVATAVLLLSTSTAPAHEPGPGGATPNLDPQVPESLRTRIEGPNMIGDDFVDQSPGADDPASAVVVPIDADALGR